MASVHTTTPPIVGGGTNEGGHAGRGCEGVGEGGTMGRGYLQGRGSIVSQANDSKLLWLDT